jgi:cytochrome c oxidase subunit 1
MAVHEEAAGAYGQRAVGRSARLGGPARRLNILTGFAGAVIGYAIGHLLGNWVASSWTNVQNTGQNDTALVLGYLVGTLGFLAGIGALNYPLGKIIGRAPGVEEGTAQRGWYGSAELDHPRWYQYFQYTLDHKVIGVQYLFGMLVYFFTAGSFALAMRTELLSPTHHIFGPDTYIQVVGEHGTMMMMMMTSVIVGPFGNYLMPLMIGSRRMAFPRLDALSFWLTIPAYVILLSAMHIGGFPTGWTGYAPLNVQATQGMDAYAIAFGLMAISLSVSALNFIVTVINFRAPGMSWTRLPLFLWATATTSFLFILAAPVLIAAFYMMLTDRTFQTAFFVNQQGGSSYLYENLFWFFGHPEVYILALPGFGVVGEILPVFCRKPLFGYKTAVFGLMGVSVLSFFVWQHHLFDSGINPAMRPIFMLTTELISIPTGIIYMVALGTLWRARMRLAVPMLFALGMYFNFLIGGVSGVFLSDVPADTTEHGTFFVLAHFHYTIMGGLMFAFIGGVYFWLPKMTGIRLSERIGKWHFWTMFVAFNSTFLPMFALGLAGDPRRVFEYARNLQTLNDWVSISAYVLGGSILIFIANLVYSLLFARVPAGDNPWAARSLEWQLPSPPPAHNFAVVPTVTNWPYDYGNPDAAPVAIFPSPPEPTPAEVT